MTNVTLACSGSVSNAAVGSYAINASSALGVGLTNYSIGYSNGTLTVGAASLLITAGSTNKIYGATLSPVDYAVSGLLSGDSVTNVTLTSSGSVSNAAVGSYAINASSALGVGLTNYSIGYSNGTLSVGAASLLITANNASKAQGNTLNFTGNEFTPAGLLNGDTVTSAALNSAGAGAGAAAGTYPIIVTNAVGSGLANYSIAYATGTLTVTNANAGALFEITSVKATNGVVTIIWNSVSNQIYQLQYNDDLATTNWTDAPFTVQATGSIASTTNAPGAVPQRFYRVRLATAAPLVPEPHIESIIVSEGMAVVTWASVAGHTYSLQYNENLGTPNWVNVLPTVTATGSTATATNFIDGASLRFYRVLELEN